MGQKFYTSLKTLIVPPEAEEAFRRPAYAYTPICFDPKYRREQRADRRGEVGQEYTNTVLRHAGRG